MASGRAKTREKESPPPVSRFIPVGAFLHGPVISVWFDVNFSPDPVVYAFSKITGTRNLYGIPLPGRRTTKTGNSPTPP